MRRASATTVNAQPSGTTYQSASAYAVPMSPPPGSTNVVSVAGVSKTAPLSEPQAFILGPGSLREQLGAYAQRNGYQLAWNHPDDFQVGNTTTFAGASFVDNVRSLFETLQDIGRWDFAATLFDGNRTLVVETARR